MSQAGPLRDIRLLVCGGPDFRDADRLDAVLSRLLAERGLHCIIQSGGPGAASLAREWARANRVPVRSFAFDRRRARGSTGVDQIAPRMPASARAVEMIEIGMPTAVVAFPGGGTTEEIVRLAQRAKLPVWEIGP